MNADERRAEAHARAVTDQCLAYLMEIVVRPDNAYAELLEATTRFIEGVQPQDLRQFLDAAVTIGMMAVSDAITDRLVDA